MSLIFPKKEILYAPMLGSTGGGSARGWGRGKGRFDFSGLTFRFENPKTSSRWSGYTYAQFETRSVAQQPDVWKGMKTITSMNTNGYVEFVAPITGTYRFTVAGARGGGTEAAGAQYADDPTVHYGGGHGRIIVADMPLVEGNTYTVLAGARGGTYFGNQSGGGGGGSFVFSGSRSTSLTTLIAAGGGGGGGDDADYGASTQAQFMNGQLASSNGAGGGYNAGTNGNGGSSGSGSEQGCSGSGVFGQGAGDSTCQSAPIINSNGAGNGGPYNQNWGGFGGGAAGWGNAGGGGGYSGGGAKVNSGSSTRACAGGGGSWYAGYASPAVGTLVSHTGLNYANSYNDNGYVTMTFPS